MKKSDKYFHIRKVWLWVFLAVCLTAVAVAVCLVANKPKEPEKPAVSQFKSDVLRAVAVVSEEEGVTYTLDERYFDEQIALDYLSVMSESSQVGVTQIKEHIWDLFTILRSEGQYFAVQKNCTELVAECDNIEKMNELDCRLLGTESEEITKQSNGFYVSQNDPVYGKIPYGTSNVKQSGCGPVSLVMAMNFVSGEKVVSVEEIVGWANENDMYEENSGTRWALIRNFPPEKGIGSEEIYANRLENLTSHFEKGGVLVASMNKGHFTENGHFIVITDISDGVATVLDPASLYRSSVKWDAQMIIDESNNYFWRIYKQQ